MMMADEEEEKEKSLNPILECLSEHTGDFWVPRNIRYLDCPTVEDFLREAVASFEPVIIRGCMNSWPALETWNLDSLSDIVGSTNVQVNVTVDGHGDCVKLCAEKSERCFVYPLEKEMPFSSFVSMLKGNTESVAFAVPYLSEQNDNFRIKFVDVLGEDCVPNGIEFSEAFGIGLEPEAINLWIGDERSVSSIHKDHFENFYAVISGEKLFTLLPPTDCAFMPPEKEFPSMRYASKEGMESPLEWPTVDDMMLSSEGCPSPTVSWIDFDPDSPDAVASYPPFAMAHPLRCRVRAGEMLYIPALWYHRVTQSTVTIAVNYWYDQRFDFRYVFFKSIQSMSMMRGSANATQLSESLTPRPSSVPAEVNTEDDEGEA